MQADVIFTKTVRPSHPDFIAGALDGDMILSILLTSILTAILVCPLLAMSAIHRF